MSSYMKRFFAQALLSLVIAGTVMPASAFSLLGPYAVDSANAVWQTPELCYEIGSVGGPLNLGEEYRFNVKTLTYGFDPSFLDYFGARGTAAVMEAVAILNALPPMSQLSADLSEFPLETKRVNYRASALGLRDLKSYVLAYLLETLGLANPERFVFTIRYRATSSQPPTTNYMVIMRNFDPVTWLPTRYVNGTLYTYMIEDNIGNPMLADAFEVVVDPLAFSPTAVASAAAPWGMVELSAGEFFIGLTRDDVGGLRYIYRYSNVNVETLATNILSGISSPWTPVYPTNVVGQTNFVNTALRPGVDKIVFQYMPRESIIGNFITVTQQYTDTYITNGTVKTQTVKRVLTQPDIIFCAADLAAWTIHFAGPLIQSQGPVPALLMRSPGTERWQNNSALNNSGPWSLSGPGQIQGPIWIAFNKVSPEWFNNVWPYFLDEASAYRGFFWVWGSFDGSTNPPVVYPNGTSIQMLEQLILGGH